MPEILSIRKAAARFGVSHVALLKASERGAITLEPDGKIDLERLARSEWARSRAEKSGGLRPVAVPSPVAPAAASSPAPKSSVEAPDAAEPPPASFELFAEADPADMQAVLSRPKIDIEKLKLAEQWRRSRLDNDEQEKKLIRAEEVEAAVEGRFREDAEALLNWPPRVSALMAAELGIDERLMAVVLEKYVRELMLERSKCPAGIAA